MKRVWTIKLYEIKDGYKATIEGEGGYAEGKSKTAYGAYAYAESKLVVKPGFVELYKGSINEQLRAERDAAQKRFEYSSALAAERGCDNSELVEQIKQLRAEWDEAQAKAEVPK